MRNTEPKFNVNDSKEYGATMKSSKILCVVFEVNLIYFGVLAPYYQNVVTN